MIAIYQWDTTKTQSDCDVCPLKIRGTHESSSRLMLSRPTRWPFFCSDYQKFAYRQFEGSTWRAWDKRGDVTFYVNFPTDRLVWYLWTQKMNCRVFKGLSNGIKQVEICWITTDLFELVAVRFRQVRKWQPVTRCHWWLAMTWNFPSFYICSASSFFSFILWTSRSWMEAAHAQPFNPSSAW